MNGDAMAFGKNVFPSSVANAFCGMRAATCASWGEASMEATGFTPRNAANSAPVGEIFAKAGASWGAPAFVRAVAKALGSLSARAVIMMVKKSAS